MTENHREALTLLEVLPTGAGEGAPPQTLEFPVPNHVAAALVGDGSRPTADLLACALALAEARLTGAPRVSVPIFDRQRGMQMRAVDIAACSAGVDGFMRALQAAPAEGADAPTAWTVMSVDTLPDSAMAQATSAWALRQAAGMSLVVRYVVPFTREGIELLAGLAQAALAVLCADPEGNLAEIELVNAAERDKQVAQGRAAGASRHSGRTIHGAFAAVASATPDTVALRAGSQAWTYRELDARAGALAAQLLRVGAGSGSIVGVCLDRSAEAVVALLAIVRIGAAYLPLDKVHPVSRLAFMMQDAAVSVVITQDSGLALPAGVQALVPEQWHSGTDTPAQHIEVGGDALAYVMYTSGSTGEPKGVEITNRAVLRLVMGVDYVQLGPATRFLHAAPLGFDASTLEIWGPLLNGGCVVVHDEPLPTGKGLASTIVAHGVTTLWLTASLFNAVVDEDPHLLAGVKQLFTGGEALSVGHVRRLRAALPEVQLFNGYGPTECTTFTTTYRIERLEDDAVSIPIGRAIPATSLYVLNAAGQLIPRGAAGELHVGGEGLARGYLGRPQLTAEHFVRHPFEPGARVYRTGDLVRWRTDDVLEFVGRIDSQIKIRGFRIEPREIETVLGDHPGVQSSAVVVQTDTSGGKRLVAYVVAKKGAAPSAAQLRLFLAQRLPDFMLPARYVLMGALPVTINGKLDRKALPVPDRSRPELAVEYEPPSGDLEAAIVEIFCDLLDLERVGRHDGFFELGGSSLLATRAASRLAAAHGAAHGMPVTQLFQYPSPALLAASLGASRRNTGVSSAPSAARAHGDAGAHEPIAIVAMAGRFPGANNVEAFWQNLCDGRDSITRFTPAELDPSIPEALREHPDYVPARGVIDGVADFDAAFFGIGAREAELMDPQQRIFLELCWECLERAGHVPDGNDVPVGVFAGMYNATYFQRHLAARQDLIDRFGDFQVMLGNEKDYIATRVAYKLNLTGPAVSVHTACSTSLVAICQAMDSLRTGRCGMALAGGASVTCPPSSGYRYEEGAMLSPDARTRTFDVGAQGTVFSDGAAVVLLKRLSDAIADGNPVYAVLRGGAVNNDGAGKASFTAPSAEAQAAVICAAHADADVQARDISYVEAHGTATPLGDPIEVEALTKAFRQTTDDTGFCRIGSVKSNVGHLVIAAGVTGVIKTALALSERTIPRSLHFTAPNPALGLEGSPFVVNDGLHAWEANGLTRLAGVSSFGVGGTNAHVVMQEAPALPESDPAVGPQLLLLSARTSTALATAAKNLARHLEAHPEANLADVAWTLTNGRKPFARRFAVCAATATDAVVQLDQASFDGGRAALASSVVFMFPGQGAQYAGMGRALYAAEPAFRMAFDECAEALRGELEKDLRDVAFGDDAQALMPTAIMQPAIFSIEYALAKTWMDHGVQPAAMIGHSVGEFVAATLAGVFQLHDALRLVAHRGRLMQARPPGAMLSVRLSVEEVLPRLAPGLSLAAENAPGSCVVAGSQDEVAAFQAALERDGVACRVLHTSHAFHSEMMEPVVAPFRELVESTGRSEPRIPIISTVHAGPLESAIATSADYWARHLREPVRFASALAALLESWPGSTLLEVGPRTTLSGLARQHPAIRKHEATAIASLSDAPESEVSAFLQAAGQVWVRGAAINMASFDRRSTRSRLRLPTYPFERQRYWVEAPVNASAGAVVLDPQPTLATPPLLETSMQQAVPAPAPASSTAAATPARTERLVSQLRGIFEDVAGFEIAENEAGTNFIELGLDSLMLTQVALQLQKQLPVKITFRQLMSECANLERLAETLEAQLPPDSAQPAPYAAAEPVMAPTPAFGMPESGPTPTMTAAALAPGTDAAFAQQVIAQQMQLMAQQLALLSGQPSMQVTPASAPPSDSPQGVLAGHPGAAPVPADEEEAALAHTRYDVKKAFGAIARIDNHARFEINPRQREKLDGLIARYTARTARSKAYTAAHRPHMADPRVVNGFRPLLKEITYQIVIERSKGAHLTDLDGNDYVDALNGFGMSLFGWQPDFVLDAVRKQLDMGYEIGPQHPLAGEVARLVCDVTGHDRAALCNTGSEAVLGALRIARTVTGRETVVVFNGAYHGIIDEMIVRGTRKLRAVPAAPGILRNTAEHVLVLDYGTPESMAIIRERADEIAAVLVEPVQSRRPDFQPVEFLRELREVTERSGALLVFDEVVTGFRAHPAGAQGLFGIQADLATYGKVVGGGYPIGVIAGKRCFMDALDGGHWQFGDDSVPTVGVTYFAGTFVRHPLALAAARAVLQHVKDHGAELQQRLNERVDAMARELNAFCAEVGAPIEVRHFASVWKTFFLEEHPLQDLLFAMMRSRGVHILDNFPCFFTTAHQEADFRRITDAFKESVVELQESDFLPRKAATAHTVMDPVRPAVAGARLGRDPEGRPAWFVPNPEAPGKYLKVG